MREFLVSLIFHLIFLVFISYNFKEPFKNKKENFLTVALVSDLSRTHSLNPENNSIQNQENLVNHSTASTVKKEITPVEKKEEKSPLLKFEIVESIESKTKKSPPTKEIVPKKIPTPAVSEENFESSPSQKNSNPEISTSLDSENFIKGNSGEKIAKSQNIDGLSYILLKAPNPNYPSQARKVRISEDIVIKTKFLVGFNGRVENIEILEGTESHGFRNEVTRTLRQWQFSPISYKDENIKLYFYKDFIFNTK